MEGLVQLPAKWQKWSVVDLIGQGTYGKVYKAECEDGKLSAIKVINIRIDKNNPGVSENFEDEDSVRNYYFDMVMNVSFEIRLMEQLKDCPHVVQIYDSQITEDKDGGGWTIYIMMEYLHNIFQLMASFGEMDEKKIADFGMQICEALEVCEEKKIVHRDIKPENIMVSDDGVYKLGDFGVAKLIEGTMDFGSIQGTYSYMAPEITRLQKYGNRADIYSLGMVLYHLLNCNRDPFLDPAKRLITYKEKEAAVERRLKGDPLPAPVDASPEMAEIILKACEFEPEDRYAHIGELKKDLELLRKGKYRLKKTKRGKNRKYTLSKKQIMISLIAIAFMMTIASFGAFWWYSKEYYIIPPSKSADRSYQYSLKRDGVFEIKALKDNCEVYYSDLGSAPWDDYKKYIKTVKFSGSFSSVSGFMNCENLETIEGLENATTIGFSAFSECTNLTTVSGLENITTIGSSAFSECTNLSTISGLENVTTIGENAFYNCTNIESIVDLENVTTIESNAFSGCVSLKIIEGLKKVKTIDSGVFSECTDLESIDGLENVTSIGEDAFQNCKSLKFVDLPDINKMKLLDGTAFDGTQFLEDKTDDQGFWIDGHTLLRYYGNETDIKIPDKVTAIGTSAFRDSEIECVTSMENVKTLEDYSFSYCINLESIIGSKNVTTIGANVFSDCDKLESIDNLENVTTIGEYAFANCTNLESIECLENVTEIGEYAFSSCSSLSSISGMENVRTIGGWAFSDCTNLKSIDIADISKISSLNGTAFDETQFLKDETDEYGFWIEGHTLLRYSGSETDIKIPEGVTAIGNSAFDNCKIESVTGMENVKTIGDSAFSVCDELESINGMINVEQIEDYAFQGCYSLDEKSVTSQLPDNCKISALAFDEEEE